MSEMKNVDAFALIQAINLAQSEQEELDAIERPVAQAQIEADEVTLANIRARFASNATPADIKVAVKAFEEGFEEWGS